MNEKNQDFDYIKIKLASPERIREWADHVLPDGEIVGEVKKPDTLNYRNFKPEMDGLFCEKIFGPVKNWECHCGKYKHVRNKITICDECKVDLTESKVRRHRMGYINLSTPVTHIWFLKGIPSYLSYVLEKTVRELEEIVYFNISFEEDFLELYNQEFFEQQVQVDPKKLLPDREKVGAEVILDLLKEINLDLKIKENREMLLLHPSDAKTKKAIRQIRLFESFLTTKTKPEWMVLTVLPVIPPGLRPMVQLDGGRFATSDLNELYRRVITRNNRLFRLLEADAPDMVVRSEKRMLQEAVDALIDNGKRGPKTLDLNNRPLKSLAASIEGKYGRFRQNLLGKRVDYSGRSVIIVDPNIGLHQCGIPFEMAIELFYPFIVREFLNLDLASTISHARKILYNKSNQYFLWDFVKKIIQGHPILLNRAPTLHRLGIQAFEPILVLGRAIQLHPLVCPAFNADFDGDQMAVHIPLSLKAQIEARGLLLAPNNFLSPATGEPILKPTQDMVLGCYYLTLTNRPNLKGSNHYFSNFEEVIYAYEQKQIELHSFIWVKYKDSNEFLEKEKLIKSINLSYKSVLKIYKNLQQRFSENNELIIQYIRTTVGRILFNQVVNTIIEI